MDRRKTRNNIHIRRRHWRLSTRTERGRFKDRAHPAHLPVNDTAASVHPFAADRRKNRNNMHIRRRAGMGKYEPGRPRTEVQVRHSVSGPHVTGDQVAGLKLFVGRVVDLHECEPAGRSSGEITRPACLAQ